MYRMASGLLLGIGLIASSVGFAGAQVYGYNNNLPSGSYQQSCTNARVNGSTLTATCAGTNGQRVRTSLNVSNCNGDIYNNNGYLRCNGYNNGGYNNGGYNNGGYNNNDGSDRENDNDRENNGQGHRKHHHRGNGNGNGYGYGNRTNTNGNNGYGYGLPPGSYQQSCQNAQMNGSVLTASCTAGNGRWVNTSLDVRRCQSATDIANDNGNLRC